MTNQEQIAYLRDWVTPPIWADMAPTVLAVCDLAERALMLEPLARAVAIAYESPEEEAPLWSTINNLYEAVEI